MSARTTNYTQAEKSKIQHPPFLSCIDLLYVFDVELSFCNANLVFSRWLYVMKPYIRRRNTRANTEMGKIGARRQTGGNGAVITGAKLLESLQIQHETATPACVTWLKRQNVLPRALSDGICQSTIAFRSRDPSIERALNRRAVKLRKRLHAI